MIDIKRKMSQSSGRGLSPTAHCLEPGEPAMVSPTRNTPESFHECRCSAGFPDRLLWTENLDRQSGSSLAWLTLYHKTDPIHTPTGHGDPKFEVICTDWTAKLNSHINVISETPMGKWLIDAWIALNPKRYAALPKTHKEWLAWEHDSRLESITMDLEDFGVDVAGLSEEDLYRFWRALNSTFHAYRYAQITAEVPIPFEATSPAQWFTS